MAELTKWVPQGNYVSIKVHRSEVRRGTFLFIENRCLKQYQAMVHFSHVKKGFKVRYATCQMSSCQDATRVYGRCGGFCGKCLPHPHTGLLVQIQ